MKLSPPIPILLLRQELSALKLIRRFSPISLGRWQTPLPRVTMPQSISGGNANHALKGGAQSLVAECARPRARSKPRRPNLTEGLPLNLSRYGWRPLRTAAEKAAVRNPEDSALDHTAQPRTFNSATRT